MVSVGYMPSQELQDLVKTYRELKIVAEEATAHLRLMEAALIEMMTDERVKTLDVDDGGKNIKATFVQSATIQVDEQGLEKEFPDDFNRWLKLVFDKGALEDDMTSGHVDPMTVGRYLNERKNKASVRLTERATND